MRKQYRILLFAAVMVATAASIAWALPLRVYPLLAGCAYSGSYTSGQTRHVGSSEVVIRLQRRSHIADSQRGHSIIESGYGALVDRHLAPSTDRIPSEVALRYVLNGKPTLLFGGRARAYHPAKRLLTVDCVSTGITIHESAARLLRSLIPVSNSILTAVLDVPLNRGPTHNAC